MKRNWIVPALILAGCGDQRPPAPTVEQAEQLNDTEAMLNEMGKEKGPEANTSDPSNSATD